MQEKLPTPGTSAKKSSNPWNFFKIVVLAGFAAVAATSVTHAYRSIGPWLFKNDPLPDEADIIFVFSGSRSRVEYAAQLAQRYPAATLVCS